MAMTPTIHADSASSTRDDTEVSTTTQAPSMVTLTFIPFNKLGCCETAQERGYINTETFTQQLRLLVR